MYTYVYIVHWTVCPLLSLHVDQCFVSRPNTQILSQAQPEDPKTRVNCLNTLRLCRAQAMVDTVCLPSHVNIWLVTHHTSASFVWFMRYGEGRCPLVTHEPGPLILRFGHSG